MYLLNILFRYIGDVTVMCNQTGEKLEVKGSMLTLEDRDITKSDLTISNQLLLYRKGKHYPVTVLTARKL